MNKVLPVLGRNRPPFFLRGSQPLSDSEYNPGSTALGANTISVGRPLFYTELFTSLGLRKVRWHNSVSCLRTHTRRRTMFDWTRGGCYPHPLREVRKSAPGSRVPWRKRRRTLRDCQWWGQVVINVFYRKYFLMVIGNCYNWHFLQFFWWKTEGLLSHHLRIADWRCWWTRFKCALK